jgi:hypothetical protein
MKISKVLCAVLLIVLIVGPSAWAQGRSPEKKKPETPPASHPVKTAKDNANQALGQVDQGVHEALHESKDAANKALNAVQESVHKVIGSSNQ